MALANVEEVAITAVPDAMIFYQRHPGPQAEREVQRIQDAMVDVCENFKDRFAVLDLPPIKDIEAVKRWRRRVDSSYAAFYYPWIVIGEEPHGIRQPPSGHVAGIFARCDTQRGCHKAPANEVITGVHGLTLSLTDDHLGSLNTEGVNTMRSFPGRGIRIWGARTASDDPSWRYVNVRRLFIMVRRAIIEGTQWSVFEPNSPATWEILSRAVGEFLTTQWKAGAFAGDKKEDAFYVKCDEETNPAEVRDQGQMVVEVGIAPALPAEFIIFSVSQQMGEQASDEAPAA
jgi:phage tail sheath protein FI